MAWYVFVITQMQDQKKGSMSSITIIDIAWTNIFPENCHIFFLILTPVYGHNWHWINCLNYFFLSIMSGKSDFWTCHPRSSTSKVPPNLRYFRVFNHFFPFWNTLSTQDRFKIFMNFNSVLGLCMETHFPFVSFPSIIYWLQSDH